LVKRGDGLRGKLIALEGTDGCGKTTHAKLLVEWLRSKGLKTVITDEPTDGRIGEILKRAAKGEFKLLPEVEALLFAADRVQHVAEIILPALESGNIVVTERYIHSSMAYQSARGLPLKWIKTINSRVPRPDLAILIDVPVADALKRIKPLRELDTFEQDQEFQKRVREKYREIADEESLIVVNGVAKIEEVQADIRKHVSALLGI